MAKRLVLYLTAKERLLLERQHKELLARCSVSDEDHVIEDSPEHRRLRAELFEPKHPVLRKVVSALARPDSTEAEIRALLAGADFTDVGTDDMIEVTFLLGPVGMTSLIFQMLTGPVAPATLDMLADLSELRRHLLFAQDDAARTSPPSA